MFNLKVMAIIGVVVCVIAVAGGKCTADEARAQADIAVACVNSGGAWIKTFGGHDCKRPGL